MTEQSLDELIPMITAENVFELICLYCLDELRRGIPEDGKCGHEALLARDKALNPPAQRRAFTI